MRSPAGFLWCPVMGSAAAVRDLMPFFDPRSVAVVGASGNPGKWGHAIAANALRGAHRRRVYLVNQSGREVLGRPTFRSLEDLPETPELVVLVLPQSGFDAALDAALGRGTKSVLAINAGFAELGAEGAEHQTDLLRRVREAGASLIGPNCLGLIDMRSELDVAWVPDGSLALGSVGLVSQSGNLGFDIARLLREAGLGISRLVSLGNQADINVTDLVRSMAEHEPTRVIAIYCEDFQDGRAFLAAAIDAVGSGKPVLLLTPGANEAETRAARSHTGALTTPDAVVDAACKASGAIRVGTPAELVAVSEILLRGPRPRGRRVAILSDGGGHAVLAAGVAIRCGLRVEPFSDALSRELTAATDPSASTANPVDLASAGPDPTAMARVVRSVARSGEADAIVMTGGFGIAETIDADLGALEQASARAILEELAAASLPMVAHAVIPTTAANAALRAGGVAVFRELQLGLQAFAKVVQAAETRLRPIADPEPETEIGTAGGYFGARAILAEAGLEFPAATEVSTPDAAVAAAEKIGYPVVLKVASLLRKFDARGVALNLTDEAGIRSAFAHMQAGLPRGTSYSLEAMIEVPDGVELMVGCRRDPRFGPVLVVGLGGILTEILNDVQMVLAPASPEVVVAALRSLRGAPLLHGARGRRAVDLEAAAQAASLLSHVAARCPAVVEIEVSPLLVHPAGALALDARMVLDERPEQNSKNPPVDRVPAR